MTPQSPHDHILRVSGPLGLSMVIEATAMLAPGWVVGSVVEGSRFQFHFDEAPELTGQVKVDILARARFPDSADEYAPRNALTPIYHLMAGLYKAGADVTVEGPWPNLLPGGGKLLHETPPAKAKPRVHRIFEDQLPLKERTTPLHLKALAEIHEALQAETKMEAFRTTKTLCELFPEVHDPVTPGGFGELVHRGGCRVRVKTNDTGIITEHVICGYTPVSDGLRFDFADVMPKAVATWGEAWMGLHLGEGVLPQGLEILPDEVAVAAGMTIHRFRIEDRTTLKRLTKLTFGEKSASRKNGQNWHAIGNRAGTSRSYAQAVKCCAQALKEAELPEAKKMIDADLRHWKRCASLEKKAMAAGTTLEAQQPLVLVRPLNELVATLAAVPGTYLMELANRISTELYDAHEERRAYEPVTPPALPSDSSGTWSFRYCTLTAGDLYAAKVPWFALRLFGLDIAGPLPPSTFLDGWFEFGAGGETIWGDHHNKYIRRKEPGTVYSA